VPGTLDTPISSAGDEHICRVNPSHAPAEALVPATSGLEGIVCCVRIHPGPVFHLCGPFALTAS
jgi:hypothetical protein